VLALVWACAPDLDPLDPQVAGDIGKNDGDALGEAWSGNYAFETILLECDCPVLQPDEIEIPDDGTLPIEPGEVVDACQILYDFDTMPAPEAGTVVQLVHADGTLAWPHWFPALAGPVDADGTFTVAGTADLSQYFVSAELVTRVDGDLDQSGFSGTLGQRVIARLPTREVDCRSEHGVSATLISP
jgi:hypothetical protein